MRIKFLNLVASLFLDQQKNNMVLEQVTVKTSNEIKQKNVYNHNNNKSNEDEEEPTK